MEETARKAAVALWKTIKTRPKPLHFVLAMDAKIDGKVSPAILFFDKKSDAKRETFNTTAETAFPGLKATQYCVGQAEWSKVQKAVVITFAPTSAVKPKRDVFLTAWKKASKDHKLEGLATGIDKCVFASEIEDQTDIAKQQEEADKTLNKPQVADPGKTDVPTVNVAALGWNDWFGGDLPSWPGWMTDAWWQDHKGKMSKVVKTGIGAALDRAHKAFTDACAVRPPKFPGHSNYPRAEVSKAYTDWATGLGAALHAALKDLKKVAVTGAVKLKESKIASKFSAQLAASIAQAADSLAATTHKTVLAAQGERMVQTWLEENRDWFEREALPMTMRALKGVGKKVIEKYLDPLAKALDSTDQNNPEAMKKLCAAASTALGTKGARDMTQAVTNVTNFASGKNRWGAVITFEGANMQSLQRISDELVPYGDGDEGRCDGLSKDEMRRKLAYVRERAELLDQSVVNLRPLNLDYR